MDEPTPERCDGASLKAFADYWVLRIIEELDLAESGLRFSALQRALGDASPATLSNRLQRLEERGVVSREEGTDGKSSVLYTLTERGTRALPILHAFSDFARTD